MPQPTTTHPSPEGMVTVRGRRLRVDVRPGDPAGTPLLVFGGIGASLEVLQPLVDHLDPGLGVIRVDVPGVGGSPTSIFPYTFPQLASTMNALLDQLTPGRDGKVDVLGYSWGGALAQQFALQFRHRVRRLVLISSSSGILSVPGNPRVLGHLLTPRYLTDPTQAAELDDQLQGRTAPPPTASMLQPAVGLGYLHQLAALSCWTSVPFLPLLTTPTLVLNGDDDPIVPAANARLLASLIPDATVQIFPGGHLEIVMAAADLGARVGAFLN